jgi:type VI secretion system protein ImpC
MPDDRRYEVNLDVAAGRDRTASAPLPDDPFGICLVGDFRGRRGGTTHDVAPLSSRRPVQVDRDDLDDVLATFAPRLTLDLDDDTQVELTFSELEHFHPDQIFQRAPFFRALREARARLASSETFKGALSDILGGPPDEPREEPSVGAGDVIADTLSGAGSVLDRVIGGEAPQDSMRAFLRRIVAPHAVPGADPGREAMLLDLDASVTRGMRSILHHPQFQALEAIWRSVFFLVRRLETGSSLKVSLLEATPAELREEGAMNGLFHALGEGPSVLVVDHTFGAADEDLDLLMMLAVVAREKGSALLAGASPLLVGLDTFAGRPAPAGDGAWGDGQWRAFRRSAEARGVGLVLPRFMLRVPYGADSDPCDYLPLEEVDSPPAHGDYLWGNGAVLTAALLGESFAAAGWRMRLGERTQVLGLPMHPWQGPDGPGLTPCTEGRITDELMEPILEAGPMVLAAVGHGDTARLTRFQSIASPARPLHGPWSAAR